MAKRVSNTRDINELLRDKLKGGKKVRIGKPDDEATWLKGNNAIAVGLEGKGEIIIHGNAGQYFGALNSGPSLVLQGVAGGYAGDSMEGGELVIVGEAGDGTGYSMRGGKLLVRGAVGNYTGMLMAGGTIVVEGNAGNYVGASMRGGTIVVTGDIGKGAGNDMKGGRILVGGEIGKLGKDARLTTMNEDDKKALLVLKELYGLKKKASIFEKIVNKDHVEREVAEDGIEMG